MNYVVEKSEGKVKITFTVLPDEWEEQVNNAYLKSKNRFNVPGFRKGHAPRKTIENFYGKGVFFDEAINSCVKNGYSKALSENEDIYPVDEPQVDIDKFDDKEIVFTVQVTVKPTVQLGAYTGIKLDNVEYTVKQDEIKAAIEQDRRAHVRKTEIKDRAVIEGDRLTIDYSGKVNGVKFEGGTAENQELVIGSKTFIPGFEEQLIGTLIGETKDITVKFPDDYHAKDLAGKDAVFTVTVHSGVHEELPEDNDDFAMEMGPYETFDAYKKDVKKRLEEAAKNKAKMANENNIIGKVVDNATIDIPECMVETELTYELDDLAYRLSASGLKLEDYFKYMGSSVEDYKKERHDEALKTVKTRLVIEQLIKELTDSKQIDEVTDDEFNKKVEEIASNGKIKAEQIKNSAQAAYIKNELMMQKLIKFLVDNNTFEKAAKSTKSKTDGNKTEATEIKKATKAKTETDETKKASKVKDETTEKKTTKTKKSDKDN